MEATRREVSWSAPSLLLNFDFSSVRLEQSRESSARSGSILADLREAVRRWLDEEL